MIEIAPIVAAHVDSFHRTLDTVARERRYLVMLEAPPLENPRSFVQDTSARAIRGSRRCRTARWSAGAMRRRRGFRSIGMSACSAWVFCRRIADRASGVG